VVFPAKGLSTDPESGIIRRHHLHETALQRALREAVLIAGIHKQVGCHTLRHSFGHPSRGERDGSPHDPGIARAQELGDHPDLHSFGQGRRRRNAEPAGCALMTLSLVDDWIISSILYNSSAEA